MTTTASTTTVPGSAPQRERHVRPLAAVLTAEAVAQVGDAKKGAGRWCINSGALMVTAIWGLNEDEYGWPKPIRLVLDLSTAKFDAKTIPALYAHETSLLVGNWQGDEADESGWDADLTLYQARTDAEAQVLSAAVYVKALLEQDHPWQCSVGAYPAAGLDGYQLIAAGKSVTVNGKTFQGDGEYPLYVMRKPRCFEGSIVLWGADSKTGQLAASLIDPVAEIARLRAAGAPTKPSKEMPVPPEAAPVISTEDRLTSLLAKHPEPHHGLVAKLVAGKKTDVEIGEAVHAAELKAKDDEIAALKAGAVKKEESPAPVAKPGQVAASGTPKFTPGKEEDGGGPKNLVEATNLVYAESVTAGKPLVGTALYTAVKRRFPNLKPPRPIGTSTQA